MGTQIPEHEECEFNHCHDCGECWQPLQRLSIIAADYGRGAFVTVLCEACDHRRWYRTELERRRERILTRGNDPPNQCWCGGLDGDHDGLAHAEAQRT